MRSSRAILLVAVLVSIGAHCQKPPAEDIAELAITAAAEAFTSWWLNETEKADALEEPDRSERIAQLEELHTEWNQIEDAFNTAQSLYRERKAVASAVRQSYERAMQFLSANGIPH